MDDDMITYDRAQRMIDYLTQQLSEHLRSHICWEECSDLLMLCRLRTIWQAKLMQFWQRTTF